MEWTYVESGLFIALLLVAPRVLLLPLEKRICAKSSQANAQSGSTDVE
jgi:hypothetical protein